MEKYHEAPSPPARTPCAFCHAPSQEVRIILAASLLRLRRILQAHRPLQGEPERSEGGAIQRLLRVLFERHQFELKLSRSCSHSQLRNLLRDKLRCKPEQLENLLEELSDRLARRNYELQIIASQIRNVENSVVELQEQEKEEVVSEKRPSTTSGEVKAEEAEVRPSYEVSPPTNSNYNLCFTEMPFQYNVLFYGHPCYPAE